MTRLRIKTADGKLERITVPDDSSLRELKEVIAKNRLCDTSTTQIRLSLNNKVELESAGHDTLRAVGICSGDTLWLMAPVTQTGSNAPVSGTVEPITADSLSVTAPNPLEAVPTQKKVASSCETSVQVPTVRDSEDDAIPSALQVKCSKETATSQQGFCTAEVSDISLELCLYDKALSEAKPSFPDLLQRVLDSCVESTHGPHQLMLLTVHAVMLETGMQLASQDSKYALPTGCLSGCSNVCHLDYALQQQQHQLVCEMKYIGLGSGMACIVAYSNGKQITTLNVSLAHHLQMQQQQQGHESESATSAFTDLQQLWTELKDDLAMKVSASLRQIAGLPPPLGLLALPADLKIKICTFLQAEDLAVMECCCTELRHTGSNDLFWQPLFQQEFGLVLTSYESMLAGRLGWQRIYALKWRDRERARQLNQRHFRPPSAYPSRGIFAPPRPPGGITGGDYDRLPKPFLGGTPGMFGGALGGSSFGGRGPAPSFFLGRGTNRAACAAGNFRLA